MEWYVDGGCRGNGRPGAIAAAAVVEMRRGGRSRIYTKRLPQGSRSEPNPTNQRAEITAIIRALEKALERSVKLRSRPDIDLTIYSDSRYAVKCMNGWIYKWSNNGWTNAAGKPVANQDLIKEASDLDDMVKELGDVTYHWIPRHENQMADEACNEELDEMADEIYEELDVMADENKQFSEPWSQTGIVYCLSAWV